MSNALARPAAKAGGVMAEVSRALEANKATLGALLPKEITPDRLKALTLTSLRKTPKLLHCNPKSILSCVYEAAKLGLQPDTATADCHIIPRKGVATFQLGYKGMMKLARRASPGIPIKAEHVCVGDEFDWQEGSDPYVKHRRGKAGTRGEITHAYAVAKLRNGDVMFKVVDADDIKRAKKTAHSTAWTSHPGAMWEKTAIKRLAKTLPIDDPGAGERLHRAIQLDDAAEDDAEQDLSFEGDVEFSDDGIIDGEARERYSCDACGATEDTIAAHVDDCPNAPPAA